MANKYPSVSLPGLAPTQSAWRMPTGEVVVVDVRAIDVPASVENLTREAHMALRVITCKANEDGTPARDAAGRLVGPPAKDHTIMLSAIAEGLVDLQTELTNCATEALDRAAQWFAVYPRMQELARQSSATPKLK